MAWQTAIRPPVGRQTAAPSTGRGGSRLAGKRSGERLGGPLHLGRPPGAVRHRDVIKDDFGGKLPTERPFRPDVRPSPRLPLGRGFTRGRIFNVRRRGKNRVRADAHVRADAAQRPRRATSAQTRKTKKK
jgi:hypothetical protein